MNKFSVVMIYLGFFALIGVSVYITESAGCLWALLLISTVKTSKDKSTKEKVK